MESDMLTFLRFTAVVMVFAAAVGALASGQLFISGVLAVVAFKMFAAG
jgi:hypothetical protein